MDIKYEFSDWITYEKRYWNEAPNEPGVIETRDRNSGEKLFISATVGGNLWKSLKRRDPNDNPSELSEYEQEVALGLDNGRLEFRYAVTATSHKAKDLRNFLLHQYIAKHGKRPLGQKLLPSQCPVGYSEGCPSCKK